MKTLFMYKQSGGYAAPSCRVYYVNCSNVICYSDKLGNRETFDGFEDAESDFFDE